MAIASSIGRPDRGRPGASPGPPFPGSLLPVVRAYLCLHGRGPVSDPRLEAIWRRFQEWCEPILGAAVRFVRPERDRVDRLQDAWLKLLQAIARGPRDAGRRDLANWVYTIARNAATDAARARSRRERRHEPTGAVAAVASGEGDPCEALMAKEAAERLARILDALSPVDRMVFEWRFARGRTPAEIAEALGRSRKDVYNRIARLRRRLACLLDESRISRSNPQAPDVYPCRNRTEPGSGEAPPWSPSSDRAP